MKTTSNTDKLLSFEGEQKLALYFTCLFFICILSGISISAFKAGFAPWLQWNIIGHSFFAITLTLPAVIYTFVHFKRTVGIRKASVLFSGLLSSGVLIGTLLTGLVIAAFGHSETQRWISHTHTILSYTTVVLIILHLALHVSSRSKKAAANNPRFISLDQQELTQAVVKTSLLYISAIALTTVSYAIFYATPQNSIPDDYNQAYGDHPFRPSLTETPNSALIHIDQIVKSEQCGVCHTDIFNQWKSSVHRQAASDPAYVKNINLLVKNKGISAARYCEGCHAPVALLTGELTEGGSHGGIKNTPAQLEGVGCMGCHGIERVINTSGVASYLFSPKEHYLFDSSNSIFSQKIRNFLIQSSPNKHRLAMGGHPMSDPKLCATCHEQFMDKDMNDWGWVKMQSTYQEWLESPFSGQANQTGSESTQNRCQDCHFAAVNANDPSANHAGQVASHRSLGANTFLPAMNGDEEQLELTKRFLQSSKVLIHIEKPTPKNRLSNKQTLKNTLRTAAEAELPYFLYLGDTGELSVTVTNRLVGHSFPAGTTDLNQAWIELIVTDSTGQKIFSSGELNANFELDKSAHIYHSTPVDRFGKAVWRHDLFNMTGESTNNIIKAGRSDIKRYQFNVPSWTKSPLTVSTILKYRKLNQRYATWALDSNDITIPVIDMARDELIIPVLEKPKSKLTDNVQ